MKFCNPTRLNPWRSTVAQILWRIRSLDVWTVQLKHSSTGQQCRAMSSEAASDPALCNATPASRSLNQGTTEQEYDHPRYSDTTARVCCFNRSRLRNMTPRVAELEKRAAGMLTLQENAPQRSVSDRTLSVTAANALMRHGAVQSSNLFPHGSARTTALMSNVNTPHLPRWELSWISVSAGGLHRVACQCDLNDVRTRAVCDSALPSQMSGVPIFTVRFLRRRNVGRNAMVPRGW